MEILIKTILPQIITQCEGTQDIIKKLASCDPYGRKSGLKTAAFLLRLSISCKAGKGSLTLTHIFITSHWVDLVLLQSLMLCTQEMI